MKDLLKKGVIKLSTPSENQYLSSIFLIAEKDAGLCPVLNLKKLNEYISAKWTKCAKSTSKMHTF